MTPEDITVALRQVAISSVSAAMRVEVPGNVGYFFLLDGEVVHASTLELTGEDAVRAMLRWGSASLAFCERRWPSERSVFRPWSELSPTNETSPHDADADAELLDSDEAPASHDLRMAPPLAPAESHFPSSRGIPQGLGRAVEANAPTFPRPLPRSSEDMSAVETSGGSGLALARAFLKL
jgi:hypothetical protein